MPRCSVGVVTAWGCIQPPPPPISDLGGGGVRCCMVLMPAPIVDVMRRSCCCPEPIRFAVHGEAMLADRGQSPSNEDPSEGHWRGVLVWLIRDGPLCG